MPALPAGDTTVHTISRRRVRIEGVVVLPTASGAKRRIRVHDPVEYTVISWTAQCNGRPPEVPHPTALDTNLVFIFGHQSAAVPIPTAEDPNKRQWVMSGEYFYDMDELKGLDSEMPTGKMPWETEAQMLAANPQYNRIPASQFKQDQIGVPTPEQ